MLRRTLLIALGLWWGGCAGGEEIDPSSLHPTGGSNTTGGQAGVPTNNNAGGSAAGAGTASGGSNGQSGGGGQSGSGGSGGLKGDASVGGAGHGGAGGSSGTSGAGGNSGASGAGGAGGAAGASGASGSAGSGGSAVMSDAGLVAGLSALYMATDSHATTHYVEVELEAKNGGSSSVPKGELKVRFYFTDEVKKSPMITINWGHVTTTMGDAQIPTNSLTSVVSPVVPAATNADTYIEFGFPSGQPDLAPGQSIVFSWRMNGPNQATDVYTQSNDYSFDAAKSAARTTWDHVVLLRNGTVVWGTPPP